ncbi:hypothetical protein GPOL_c09340 [Gordonia polyisoprenivorans VH2]|uniref:Uncharacterized protein n=1 Tax=Gordonia polyisoprenivorans (strain DSM 44266 / VH2) TaxID=1112204 RepID=H6MZL0_GORPV|nr:MULTISPECIES: hypothetical protein [Gordonia]AFA71997.1 hypothetical protein GPOL_c09340 [Gordonia polyisoprenivorans VH2]MDF3280804.1 hypothetical protein [Gordonia sp. N1V]OPX11766.1 hypothetical protein B1964_22155 [Gordonia sp. i37]
MKRLTGALVAVAVATLGLAACGNDSAPTVQTVTRTTVIETTTTTTTTSTVATVTATETS